MKKFNIFKKMGAVLLSSMVLFTSTDVTAFFTEGYVHNVTINIEDMELSGTHENTSPGDEIPDGAAKENPMQETDSMDDFQQEIIQLNQNTDLNSDSMYASKRLVAITDASDFDTYGAENVISYGNLYVLSYPSESATKNAYYALKRNADITSVEIDSIVETSSMTGMETMEVGDTRTEAVMTGKDMAHPSDIRIAVIDSGIDKNNPLFDGKIIDLGLNFSTSGDGIQDDNGHGTAVASIIANNSDALIMPIKIANNDGKGTVLGLYLAVQSAIENRADIINLSMTTTSSELLASIIGEADKAGITVVASAGNESSNVENFAPANITSVITVGSVNQDYSPASYSNYGEMIDYAAVGTDVGVETLNGTRTMSGTSFSAAYVSAVMAYAMDNNKTLDDYVYPVEEYGGYYGKGIVSFEYADMNPVTEKDWVQEETGPIEMPTGNGDYISLESEYTTAKNYIAEAANITYYPSNKTIQTDHNSHWGNFSFITYTNRKIDTSKYIVYENAVISGDKKYDLVMYPFRCQSDDSADTANINPRFILDSSIYGKVPSVGIITHQGLTSGYVGFKLVITEHGNINSPIDMNDIYFGLNDLDYQEYVVVPNDFNLNYQGDYIKEKSTSLDGKKYIGTQQSTGNMAYTTNALIGKINIPKEGITIYYGEAHSSYQQYFMSLSFEEIIDNNGYTIQFDANGGSGSIPLPILKYGSETSTVMGNMEKTVPARSGYIFRGWSANPSFNSKRIAYDSSHGGSAASDGTGATTTGSSWTYADYCSYTGGDSSNRELILYAQWEQEQSYTHTLAYNANGGSNAPSSSTVTNSSSTYNMTVSGTQPTRTGYTFAGWNTNSSGTGTNYSAGGNVSVGANATVTLYAKWTPITYSVTYNGNGNTGGSTAPQTKTYGASINLQRNGFTKTGYHFTDWNTTSGGTGTSYPADAGYSTNANLTLYAQWTINSSTLKVNPNNGSWNGSTGGQSFTQNYNTTKSIPVPTRTGYTFTGWTRTNTYGSLSSTTSAATYTFGSTDGVTDTITAGWKANNYTVTYIDRIKDTTTQLGTSSTASKPYGSTVRGSDKGSSTAVGAYHTGYYYVSDTSATVTTSGATVYRYFRPQNYTVTYIDVVDSTSGKELGRSTAPKPYNSTVRGSDKGNSTADNAYHNGYYYVSDTSATVTTGGATVYRIFKQRMNIIAGNIIWEDWNNKNSSRPANVTLYIHGSDGKTYTYTITGDNSRNTSVNKWPYSKEVPKYDSAGKIITYTVTQDKAVSLEEGLAYKDPVVNGYDVTNKISNEPDDYTTFDYIKVPVTIIWDDDNDKNDFRPDAVTITLLQNGTVIKTVFASNDYTFEELLKYDENGDKYVYTITASDEDRYTKAENNSAPYSKSVTYTFIRPTYSVIIPKVVILDGSTGIGEYVVSVSGQIDDRDFVNVIPDGSFTMENDYLSPITANVKQDRTAFTNKENIKAGATSSGTITTKSLAGRWSGSFNFNIYFEFGR